jgi:drug/metabolite transporter (DMT)-like permease
MVWLVLLLYLLMASTFTVAKTAVLYMQPLYFIGFRMAIAGAILLAYIFLFRREKIAWNRADLPLFVQIAVFHIYCAYVFEFWGLQYISSAKACLLYNLSPFFTALFSYLIFKHTLSSSQWLGLIVGFCAIIPLFAAHSLQESFANITAFSVGEIALLISVASAAYGWIVMKKLVVDKGYSTAWINGVGMFVGGIAALLHAVQFHGLDPLMPQHSTIDWWGSLLMNHFDYYQSALIMSVICMLFLIIVANIIGYNLYGYLLKIYSPTFLSFAGSMTPIFAAIFGWFLLNEPLTAAFFVSLAMTILGLYLFYGDEIRSQQLQ